MRSPQQKRRIGEDFKVQVYDENAERNFFDWANNSRSIRVLLNLTAHPCGLLFLPIVGRHRITLTAAPGHASRDAQVDQREAFFTSFNFFLTSTPLTAYTRAQRVDDTHDSDFVRLALRGFVIDPLDAFSSS